MKNYLKKKFISVLAIFNTMFAEIFPKFINDKLNNLLFSLVPHPQEPKQRDYHIKKVEFTNSTYINFIWFKRPF